MELLLGHSSACTDSARRRGPIVAVFLAAFSVGLIAWMATSRSIPNSDQAATPIPEPGARPRKDGHPELPSASNCCASTATCGVKFFDLQKSIDKTTADALWESLFNSCEAYSFSDTTCDGAAQYMDVVLNFSFVAYNGTAAYRSAACSKITSNIEV
jgi:hypothetical protein